MSSLFCCGCFGVEFEYIKLFFTPFHFLLLLIKIRLLSCKFDWLIAKQMKRKICTQCWNNQAKCANKFTRVTKQTLDSLVYLIHTHTMMYQRNLAILWRVCGVCMCEIISSQLAASWEAHTAFTICQNSRSKWYTRLVQSTGILSMIKLKCLWPNFFRAAI